ncbi:MAG: nitrophenyl compound nitroreductase subunit ArsF family protein [Bacteroidales bacterium]|jgi:hypothetical protein|nr:nitrophenyl compound nitroreductase subunit ArsF family protein [Bacteroidales bacterium]MDD4002280.1 nitrophenyl compound nitroreductase subunit ArsF family protein [Bacteroidales bacterium]MDD4529095.1 nitrophenyl compound nitroreductase subunit ArsF family protein [Bacteroidales bacterium]MDD4830012.1 nitrophenyl compound nitroreductase subunit ArsF family protein [Bacteroidales bacterium]
MKKITLLVFSMLVSVFTIAQNQEKELLEIYYFHRTERCATCNSIEEGINSTLEKYKKEINKGEIAFKSLNYEVDLENQIIKSYEIESPTLLFIYNKKGKKEFVDLTEEAFSYALSNPSKFRKVLKEKINEFFR